MEAICAGLNVLELGSGSAAASIAGVILADAGAQVIKIEAPDGDRLRTENPNGFLVWNRGKDSVVADLHTTGGRTASANSSAAPMSLSRASRPAPPMPGELVRTHYGHSTPH